MSEKQGIMNVKEAAVAVAAVAQFAVECVESKSVDPTKALALYPKIQAAAEGYKSIVGEAMYIDAPEAAEVVLAVAAELNILPEKAKNVLVASVELFAPIEKLVKAIKA